jgi:hypothetical protein
LRMIVTSQKYEQPHTPKSREQATALNRRVWMPGATCTWQHDDFLYNAQFCTGDIWLVMGYVRVVGCGKCAVSAWERIRVKQRECQGKFGRGESTTLTAGKALRFVDNI